MLSIIYFVYKTWAGIDIKIIWKLSPWGKFEFLATINKLLPIQVIRYKFLTENMGKQYFVFGDI